ncbi:hypothetical protein CVD28_25515 [Bacillus sp. M6-12]|uniref:ABC transporter permease subunit n=1 Tax=Bacillus sp. M6-12 TaxID=2054166 RepID=UPI000C76AFCA|nr:ABC transporter permease subunit [Bacillus sp. M6-12]PLS14882.1 hypothetical protein CVD28_25515 [Bacillus sp. M6-12]
MKWLRYKKTIIGLLILIALFTISWFTEPHPESNKLLLYDKEGNVLGAPPVGPSSDFPLGTDKGSRSMLHLVLEGFKYSIAASLGIGLLTVLAGSLLGLVSAVWFPAFKLYFKAFFLPFQYIPALLIGIILLSPVALFPRSIPPSILMEYEVLILLIIGLPPVFFFITSMAEEIKQQPYVMSSSLLGASKLHIIWKHILPNLKSHLVLLSAQQILQILQLLTFLGIFSLYWGGPHPSAITSAPDPVRYRSITSELAGMTGQNYWLFRRAPWMALSAIGGVAVIALIVNSIKKEIESNLTLVPSLSKRKWSFKRIHNSVSKTEPNISSGSFALIGFTNTVREGSYTPAIGMSEILKFKLMQLLRGLSSNRFNRFVKISGTVLAVLVIALYLFSAKNTTTVSSSIKEPEQPKTDQIAKVSYTNRDHIPVNYKADLTYNEDEHTVSGKLFVETTNYTGKKQDHIYFHLYPNQFSKDLPADKWQYFINETSTPGSVEISKLLVNKVSTNVRVKDTILDVPVKSWGKNETANIEMDFIIKLPQNFSYSSYDYAAVWLGNWLPIQAVYDKNGWNKDPFYPIGNPFYSETANYDVTVTAPAKYTIATNADDTKGVLKHEKDTMKYQVKAENIRDFSLVLMDAYYYSKLTIKAGNTFVNIWHSSTDNTFAARNKTIMNQAMSYYTSKFGDFPYPEYDLVRVGEGTVPMNYPGMSFIPGYAFKSDFGSHLIANGLTSQWWSGLVGNNNVSEPWLSDSLNTYWARKFINEKISTEKKGVPGDIKIKIKQAEEANQYLGSSLADFQSEEAYSMLIGFKGPDMFSQLEEKIGEQKMLEALKAYQKEYGNKNASGKDFIKVFSDTAGKETGDLIKKWLEGKNEEE